MINITFPDGNIKGFENNPTGLDVAMSISEGLARNCVAMKLDSELMDLNTKITQDSRVRLITANDPEALEILRHSASHVMAQAILHLYKDAKLTIGPAVENGFYYDIDMPPLSEDDFAKIEAEMKKTIKAKVPFRRRVVSKSKALEFYKDEPYKLEMINELEDVDISFYEHEDFTDLCRGPHLPHTGFIKAVKLMKVSGAYWRADQTKAQLQRIYGTAFFTKKELNKYLHFLEEAKKRNHRKIGIALDLFSFHDEAPGMPFFHAKGMVVWNALLEYWREEHRAAGYVDGLVHRHELSGVLSGLFRVRAFHQDDAHIFMTPEQIQDEILGVLQLEERIYKTFGLGFDLELSTRPEKSIGSDAQWEVATKGLEAALDTYGKAYKINEGDGAFYGPKIDFHIKDALGRTWQCGTVQLDMSLPERFDLFYIDKDNEKRRPIMIHRTVYGRTFCRKISPVDGPCPGRYSPH